MKLLFCIVALLFFLVAVVLFILSISLIFRSIRKPEIIELDLDNKIKENLMILSSDATPEDKATAVEQLIEDRYITIHTLKNKGNDFNDKTQVRIYKRALTKENVKVLFDLEANNGGYSF